MADFSPLQELSATIFGVNVAYLALNQFRYKHVIQEYALLAIKNARLEGEVDIPNQIISSEIFRDLTYLCGPQANLYHINSVMLIENGGDLESKYLLRYTDYKEIKTPNRDENLNKISSKFDKQSDHNAVLKAASVSFMILILSSMDEFYNFNLVSHWMYLSHIAFWTSFFVLMTCLGVPLLWIKRGRSYRDGTIAWIDKGAPQLFQASWTWIQQRQLREGEEPELNELAHQPKPTARKPMRKPNLEEPKI